jgi:histidyl-tRNA synthetase
MSNRYRFQSNGSCFEVFGKFGRDYVFCVTEYPFVEYVEVIAQGTPTGSKVVYAIFNVLDKESLTQQLSRHYGQNISLIEF